MLSNVPVNVSAQLEDGALVISADDHEFACVPLDARDTFYAETTVIPLHCDMLIGFCIGDPVTSQYHYFLLGDDEGESGYAFAFFDNERELLRVHYGYEGNIGRNQSGTIGLEAINGTYRLFLNEDGHDEIEITPYGVTLGVAINNLCCSITGIATTQFQSVFVRDQR